MIKYDFRVILRCLTYFFAQNDNDYLQFGYVMVYF